MSILGRSENHQICIRRVLFFKDKGFVKIIQAMLHHKPYGPGKRITRQSRQVMSEELGPLLCELVGELVDFEIDALSKDPRSAKLPADVTGEDAQSFDSLHTTNCIKIKCQYCIPL